MSGVAASTRSAAPPESRFLGGPPVWALAVLALTAAVMAGLRVTGDASTWRWVPITSPVSDLVLVAEPQELTFAVPGEVALQATQASIRPVTLFDSGAPTDFGSLRLLGLRDLVFVEFASAQVPALSLPARVGEQVVLTYRDDTLALQSGPDVRTAPLRSLEGLLRTSDARQVHVAGPRIDPSLVGKSHLAVSASPSTLRWPSLGWALALASLMVFARAGHLMIHVRLAFASAAGPRVAASDVAIAGVGVLALLFNPPLPDDNWVLVTNRQYGLLGFFSNYYTANAAPQPQGFWWTLIEHLWLGQYWIPAFWLRVPSLLILLAGWWVLRRHVVAPLVDSRYWRPIHAMGGFVVVTQILAWAPTLRPEPLVAFLSVLALVFALRLRVTRQMAYLQLVGAAGALALAAHQSGVLVVGVFVGCLAFVWRADPTARARAVATAAGVGLIGMVLLLLNSNLDVARWAARSFATEGLHDAVLDEIRRFDGLTAPETPFVRLFAGLLVLLAVFAYLTSQRSAALGDRDFIAWLSIAGLLSLVFTSSKWPWHLGGATMLVTAVILMALGNALTHEEGQRRFFWLFGGALSLGVSVALARPFESARLDLVGISLADVSAQPWYRLLLGPWTFLILATVLMWLISRRMAPAVGFTLMAAFIATAVVVRTFTPALVDLAVSPTDSWPSVMAASMRGDACGLLAAPDMEVPTDVRPLALAAASVTTAKTRKVVDQQGPLSRRPVTSPVRAAAEEGETGSPWFSVSPGERIRIYYAATGLQATRMNIVFADDDLQGVNTSPVSRTLTESVWAFEDVTVPAGATRIASFWNTWDGPSAVQDPVEVVSTAPVPEFVGDGALWTNPATGLWGSCLRMPRIDQGVYEAFDWSLDYPRAGSNAALWKNLASISEQACRELAVGDRFCIYRMDRYYPQLPPTSRTSVGW